MNIDDWFTSLARIPLADRPAWLRTHGLRWLQKAADQVGASDADFLTKKQCIEYLMENF